MLRLLFISFCIESIVLIFGSTLSLLRNKNEKQKKIKNIGKHTKINKNINTYVIILLFNDIHFKLA